MSSHRQAQQQGDEGSDTFLGSLFDSATSSVQDLMGNSAVAETLSMAGAASIGSNTLASMPAGGEEDENTSAARQELMAKLQVGEGDKLVDGKAMVSQEQFDHMLKTYADIRSGDSNIKVSTLGMSDKEAEEFRNGTLDTMTTMMQTEAGRELLGTLGNQTMRDEHDKREIIISNGLRSYETKNDGLGNETQHTIGNRAVARNQDAAHIEGMGTGSAVFLTNEDRELKTMDGTGSVHMPKDAVMFHEMTHALHNLEGTRDKGYAGEGAHPDDDRMENQMQSGLGEEYATLGLGEYEGGWFTENNYREQRRAQGADAEKYAHRDRWTMRGDRSAPDTTNGVEYGEGGWPTID